MNKAITAVAAVAALGIVLVVAEVIGDLALQGGLQHPLGELLQQPALTGQLQALAAGPVHQHPDQLVVRHRLRSRGDSRLLHGPGRDDGLTHLASP
ncbi:hypothetical protein GCM10017744_104700 [Streptomyces antimycoticus]|uniref:Uncharacterized protein n=1 Tax=Streptomyces antimycoticus TaxID=68175 RepID=A0A4D4KLY4_9ACTN|nr:hypothetical protein SANT12839_100760 [Streptomyces antimycoticus]